RDETLRSSEILRTGPPSRIWLSRLSDSPTTSVYRRRVFSHHEFSTPSMRRTTCPMSSGWSRSALRRLSWKRSVAREVRTSAQRRPDDRAAPRRGLCPPLLVGLVEEDLAEEADAVVAL